MVHQCPSYFIALDILEKDCGHKSVAVPMAPDGTGVDVAELEEAVKREHARRVHPEGQGKFWAMFYTIPTFHNPTGSVMSPEKCSKVVELARRYDFVVVCDDVYNLLHYGPASKSPKRLLAYDTASHSEYKVNRENSFLGFTLRFPFCSTRVILFDSTSSRENVS